MLEANCLVGIGAIVLNGAVVGTQSIIAAGAVVTTRTKVPPGQLWVGNPARFLRNIKSTEPEFLAWNAAHYVRLGAEYRETE